MDPGRPLEQLSDSGMLWYINRVAFHPHGFAMAIHTDDEGRITGWSLMGDGQEVWAFDIKDDDTYYARIQETLAEARKKNDRNQQRTTE